MTKTKKIPVSLTLASNRDKSDHLAGFLSISPWLIGFILLILGPMLASLYLSFTDYNLLSSPSWVGLANYRSLLTDARFLKSLEVTFTFVFVSVPLKLIFALALAMLFNTGRKGSSFFSAVYYIPSIIGGSVAIAVVWKQLFGRQGAVTQILSLLNITDANLIGNPDTALSVLILLVIWQFGSPMIIFLAGLRQIPIELYEAASVDGASKWRQFFNITLPMLTPVIFFNLVMQTIQGFMTFTQAYLITGGGPLDETLFYAVYLYETAFEYLRMGYASAMAWVLLIIIAVITLIFFLTSKYWVFYQSEGGR
ncbi:carbohydrate ABC transporter permease [Amphibacillus cookii]|uniref:carbohydrate ABC transporter permease n=1 Tax=Amphibacillus cookii TaxID=767787 RepID=UPI001956D770|nr:sugar ABC transporter permease [Amphibacillus cookii]MBM7541561.1 multiple sugar transport system permease protein [Amphibacillus cookii]